eukprot:gene5401-5796_t
MDIYLKTPGSTLIGLDRITFDDILNAVNTATNEYLLRPDWDANLRCVELIKTVNNLDLLHEVTLVLRKKLRASQPKVVVLTLRLMETLTTNCGNTWFYALNAEPVTKDLANVARKYIAKTGPENKEVTDTCLDVVQGWGEAFLPRKKQFPNIVELYFTLRKEGLPFKVNNQFDPSRVPIFEKPSAPESNGGVYLDAQTDAILAATLQASMDLHTAQSNTKRSNSTSSSSNPPPRSNNTTKGSSGSANRRTSSSSTSATNGVIESMSISITILKELILASSSIFDLKSNEVINEIIDQIRSYQVQIHSSIENSMDNPELLANLFKYNDYSQTLLSIYSDIKDGSLSLTEGQKVISTALNFDEQESNNTGTNEKNNIKQAAAPASVDLLDYDSVVTASPAKPAAVAPSPAKPVVTQSNIHLDFFSAPVAQPVASTNTISPAPAPVPSNSAAPPAPLNKAPSSSIPRLAPPPTGKVPFLAPPPKAGSTVRSNSISESPAKPVAPQPAVNAQVPASSSSGLLDFDPFGSGAPIVSATPTPAAPVAPVAPAHVPNQPFQPFAAFPPQTIPANPAFNQPFNTFPSQPLQPTPAAYPPQYPAPGFAPPPGAYPYPPQAYPGAPPAGYPYPPNPYPPQGAPLGFPPNTQQYPPSTIPPAAHSNNNPPSARNPADNPFDLF